MGDSVHIFAAREPDERECRAALSPESVRRLVRLGAEVGFETGLGDRSFFSDAEYVAAGGRVVGNVEEALSSADVVFCVQPPPPEFIRRLKPGATLIGFLAPWDGADRLHALVEARVQGVAMELIPRSTLAQKMDALSSQASLAGYVAVLLAAARLPKVLPMMMTPAGTLLPARVFVIGAGVAGLQAIATARRLGARVEAYDTRPAVEEQVRSLGARFVHLDLGETGQTAEGYAKPLTEDQIRRQRELLIPHCSNADIVITTAQVFGRRAPMLVTDAALRSMRPGSVVVDLAAESGGNVEGITPGREEVRHGVRIVALTHLPSQVAAHATQMYASNLAALIEHVWDTTARRPRWATDDEILRACTLTHDGAIVHPRFATAEGGGARR